MVTMDLGEIQELMDTMPKDFTEDNLVVMSASKPGPNNEEEYLEEAEPENKSMWIEQSGRSIWVI